MGSTDRRDSVCGRFVGSQTNSLWRVRIAIVIMVAAQGPATIVAAALAGVVFAVLLTLALALPSRLAGEADVPRLSAAMFTIGFGFAMAMSVGFGLLSETTGMAALAAIAGMTIDFDALDGRA